MSRIKGGTRLIRRLKRHETALFAPLLLLACHMSALPASLRACPPQASARVAEDTAQLVAHKPIQQKISKGEVNSYQIFLDSDQYFHLKLNHPDADVGISLHGPDNNRIVEYYCDDNSITGLSAITESSGIYRLNICLLEKGLATGRYELEIDELRQATPTDKTRILAERSFAEGARLCAAWEAQAYRVAIKKYEEALSYWKSIGEVTQQAAALRSLGETYNHLGEYQKALYCYTQALTLSRGANNPFIEVQALNGMSAIYLALGENQKALEFCNEALRLSRVVNDQRGEVQALSNIGDVQYAFGRLQESLGYYTQALLLSQSLNDRRGQSQALMTLGYVHSDLSDTRKAFDFYDQALTLWRGMNNRRGEAQTLTALGHLHSKLGEKQEALNYYNEAARLFQPIGDKLGEAFVLNGLGYVYDELGEKKRALEYHKEALRLFQSINYREGEGGALMKIGRILYSLGDNKRALGFYQQALLVFRGLNNRRWESHSLRDIGLAYDSMGDKPQALDYYWQSLKLSRANEDRRDEAYTLNYIGRLYHASGEKEKALAYYNQALPLNRTSEDRFGESLTLYNIARAERDSANLAQARAIIEEAIKTAESLRAKIASHDLRSSYLASIHQYYEFHVDLLLALHKQNPSQGFEAAALQASERARARSLLEMLNEAHADIRQEVEPALLEREDSLQRQIDTKERARIQLLNANPTEEQKAAAEKELSNLVDQYKYAQAEIRAKNPRYAALTQPKPLSLKEIQEQVLDPDTLLLEYSLGDERSYLWAVTQTSITSYELPGRKEIESQAKRVYELLTARQSVVAETAGQRQARAARADADYWPQAARLSQMLLGDVASQLRAKRLLVVTEGALQYVPFSALPAPGGEAVRVNDEKQRAGLGGQSPSLSPHPLILDHEIINLPSASVLAILRRDLAGRKPAAKAVAVLADPVFDKDDFRIKSSKNKLMAQAAKPSSGGELSRALRDVGISSDGLRMPRLRSSRREASAIQAVASAQGSFEALDFEANRAMAMSQELAGYRIVHFATHGVLDSERPELSGIVLSLFNEQGKSQNGFLRLHDIYNLNLPAELVVLSACSTGLGKDMRGEGLVGLTRGFMYAGARRVMASLWNVNDLATANLMERFYKAVIIGGLPPAAALRSAQVEMLKQSIWKAPYYWAAFVLQGEWK